MSKRVVIPTMDENGLDSMLSEHFGRAPFFTVLNFEGKELLNTEVVPNTGEHFGGVGQPADNIIRLKPDALIAFGMGPRAINIFQQAGVAVLRANAARVREVVEAFKEGNLMELTEGCHEARHK